MDQPVMYYAAWASIIIALIFSISTFIVVLRKQQTTEEQVFIAITGHQLLRFFEMESNAPLKVLNISRVQSDFSVDVLFETEVRDYTAVFDLDDPKNSHQIGSDQSLTITFTDSFLESIVGMQPTNFLQSRRTVEGFILNPQNIQSMHLITTKALQ